MTVARNASGRVAEPRPRMVRLMTYWMILTIGPLLLGASLSLSSYGFVSAALEQGERAVGLTQLLPFLLAAGAFPLLHAAVPPPPVAFHHALPGGLFPRALFDLLHGRFGFYLRHFPSFYSIHFRTPPFRVIVFH